MSDQSDAAKRQQKTRDKRAASGARQIRPVLGAGVYAQLQANLVAAGGWAGTYETTEYISALIRQDAARLAAQLAAAGACGLCGQALPQGCGGDYRTDSGCEGRTLQNALKVPL